VILARLVELHDRLAAQGAFPRVGFTEQSIAYILVIDVQGVLHDVLDLIDKKTAKYGKKYLVPSSVPRSSNILPNLFWDKIDYVLGVSCEADPAKMKAKKSGISAEMMDTANTYDDKVALIRMIVGDDSARVASVLKNMIKPN
jgi:hypothetical protein